MRRRLSERQRQELIAQRGLACRSLERRLEMPRDWRRKGNGHAERGDKELAPIQPYADAIVEFKRAYWSWVFEQAGWCVIRAARLAQVNRTYLHKVLAEHQIKRPAGKRLNKEHWARG